MCVGVVCGVWRDKCDKCEEARGDERRDWRELYLGGHVQKRGPSVQAHDNLKGHVR